MMHKPPRDKEKFCHGECQKLLPIEKFSWKFKRCDACEQKRKREIYERKKREREFLFI